MSAVLKSDYIVAGYHWAGIAVDKVRLGYFLIDSTLGHVAFIEIKPTSPGIGPDHIAQPSVLIEALLENMLDRNLPAREFMRELLNAEDHNSPLYNLIVRVRYPEDNWS